MDQSMRHFVLTLVALCVLVSMPTRSVAAPATQIVRTEFRIPGAAPDLTLYLRNKRLGGTRTFGPSRTVLFVHGATYPASTTFDLALDGKSWMDELAREGFDVWLVDLQGYGQSTRPKAMDGPPEAAEPVETTEQAQADVGRAVDFILQTRKLDKLDLIGWSWGTVLTAGYTAANNSKVERLVLYAPVWINPTPGKAGPLQQFDAYRLVTPQAAFDRWMAGVPEAEKSTLLPTGWFDTWREATWATDPQAGQHNPPMLRGPLGVYFDVDRYWKHNRPMWDPAQIKVPVMLAVGEWDNDQPPARGEAIFPLLINAPWKQFVMIGKATHMMMLESRRQQLFDATYAFLVRTDAK